ncbi:MAG: PAS domain S-box-containing protein [Flammeovirgaceae bacterium]|jgi:PAS domain S-box-containing protein
MSQLTTQKVLKVPYFALIFFSLIGLVSVGWQAWQNFRIWNVDRNEQTALNLGISGIALLSVFLLVIWLVVNLLLKIRKLRKIKSNQEKDLKFLRGEITANERDVDIQSQMLYSFMNQGNFEGLMSLASELLRVQNVSFWRMDSSQSEMECLEAYSETKGAFQKGGTISTSQFPSLFSVLKDNDCIQYPLGLMEGTELTGEPIQPMGSLLHYTENEQIQAMMIVPLEVEGTLMGAAWFEHREVARQWTERDRKQAYFVTSLVRMRLFKDLQYGIIEELSEGLTQTNNLINQVNLGIGKFSLTETCTINDSAEELAKKIGECAVLEESNENIADFFPLGEEDFMGKRLAEFVNEEVIEKFVESNFLLSDFEFERTENEKREVLKISIFSATKNDELSGLWLLVQDITQSKQKEWEMELLIKNNSNILTILDEDNHIKSDSPSIKQAGYNQQERVGHNIISYFEPKDAERLEKCLRISSRVHSEETATSLRMRKANGNWAYYDAVVKKLNGGDNSNHSMLELIDISGRIRKEQEIGEQQQFYSSLIEQSGEVAIVLEKAGEISFESANMKQIFGYETLERIGRNGFEYIHSQNLPELERAWKRVSEGKTASHHQDIQFLHKNGSWKNAELSMQQGQQGAVNIWIRDITGVKEVEQTLKNRAGLIGSFLEKSDKIFLLTDSKGKIKFATGCVKNALGIDANKLIGKNLVQLALGKEREAVEKNLQVLAGNPKADIEMHLTVEISKENTQKFALESRGKVLEKAYSGLLFELSKISEETVDKKTIIKASFFQSIANNLPDALLFVDSQGKIKYGNLATKQLFGKIPKGLLTDFVVDSERETISEITQSKEGNITFELDEEQKAVEVRLFDLEGSILNGTVWQLNPKKEIPSEIIEVGESNFALTTESNEVDSEMEAQRSAAQLSDIQQENAGLKENIEQLKQATEVYTNQIKEMYGELGKRSSSVGLSESEIDSLKSKMQEIELVLAESDEMKENFDEMLELLNQYREINLASDLEVKLKELSNFEELINFENALNESKTYIEKLQSLSSNSNEFAKG